MILLRNHSLTLLDQYLKKIEKYTLSLSLSLSLYIYIIYIYIYIYIYESHALPHTLTNIEHVPDDFLNVLTQISSKKYLIKITLIFSDDFKLDVIALFDTGANLNCIKEGVVPK